MPPKFLKFQFALIILFPVFTLLSCASQTVVYSSDPQAQVSIPSRSLAATGSVHITSWQPIWETTAIVVSKQGCPDRRYIITRRDEFNPLPVLLTTMTGGISLLWSGGYLNSYQLDYQCTK